MQSENMALPLHAFRAADITEGILAVGDSVHCELPVRVPEETYKQKGQFEFAVMQVWEGIEVGRLAFRFGP